MHADPAPVKVLLIGGTGTISTPICERLSEDPDIDLYVMNRGHQPLPVNATQIVCDFHDIEAMERALAPFSFDVVCNFIVYHPQEARQQVAFFKGKIRQYIFISTVVVYDHETAVMIDETQKQGNVFSLYGQEKSACEQIFYEAWQKDGFPVTVVRPSQTYGKDRIPLSVKGNSCWSVIDRIQRNRPVIIHGDGKSTWHCTHTEDFAHNFLQLINNEKTIGNAFHNIHPMVVNWDMIYHHLYRLLHREPQIVHIASDTLALSTTYDIRSSILGDKQYSNLFDTTSLQEVISDFRYTIDIQEGLRRYLNYMEAHPEKKRPDPVYDAWCDHVIDAYRSFEQNLKGTF